MSFCSASTAYGQSVAVEAVCLVTLNYAHCDTPTPNSPREWPLHLTATHLLKKGDMAHFFRAKGRFSIRKTNNFLRPRAPLSSKFNK